MKCPDCNGEGCFAYETGVNHDGYVEIAYEPCQACEGTGNA